MTIEQTRQMSIEFERRLQTIFPATKMVAKIDTEEIFSYLNQYQIQYLRDLYMSEDQVKSNTRPSSLIQDVLRTFIKHQRLTYGVSDGTADKRNRTFKLPSDYYQYVRSSSEVYGTYKNHTVPTVVPNMMIKNPDIPSVIESYYDDGRILRQPIVVLEGDRIKVVHDQYTTVNAIDLTYLRLPSQFSILTNQSCELPYECFEPLVSGALDLYVQHLQASQPKQRNNEQNKERTEK